VYLLCVCPLAPPPGVSAAAHLGLPEGLLVAQGGSDAFIGMVGLGVVKAGQMAMLTGEGHQLQGGGLKGGGGGGLCALSSSQDTGRGESPGGGGGGHPLLS